MNKLNKAIILSAKIHSGKKGRNNEPAVLHSIRVMNQMKSNKGRIAGVLHDVVETEKISIDDLVTQGFGKSICKTVDALSRRKWEKYDDYINRLKKNKLAIKVKLEDLIDNYSTRLSYEKKSKLDLKKIKKYEKAYKSLTGKKIQANF